MVDAVETFAMTINQTSPVRPWATATHHLMTRRAARSARQRMAAELAGYSTPAERTELDAMLARHEYAEVADIRRIVDRTRAA